MKTFTNKESMDVYFRKLPIKMRTHKAEKAWDTALAILERDGQVKFKWDKNEWFQIAEAEIKNGEIVCWNGVPIDFSSPNKDF